MAGYKTIQQIFKNFIIKEVLIVIKQKSQPMSN